MRELLAEQRRALVAAESVATPDLEWLRSLERINTEIDRVWGPVSHLNSVVSTPPLRDAFNRCLPLVTEFGTELGQNETLYRHFSTLQERVGAGEARRAAADRQRAARLSARRRHADGSAAAALSRGHAAARRAAGEVRAERHGCDRRVRASRDRPRRARGLAAVRARPRGGARGRARLRGWCLRLDPPTYQTVLAHAESAALREKYYQAWVTRASDQGPHAGRWDNGPLIEEILALRHEAAQLVGFKTFAEFSLATKMAESPRRVIEFLRDLARRSRAVARDELAMLTDYAGRKLEAWDVAFYAERLKQEKLELAEEELRPYFPLPRVLDGLFKLCGTLFDLRVAEAPRPDVWHDSVRYYELAPRRHADRQLLHGSLRAAEQARRRVDGRLREPREAERPARKRRSPTSSATSMRRRPSKPSLLTHTEVVTLFHEFGHALHHLLTEVDYPSLAGINGVAWDAVELPSQFLENFTWRPEVLGDIGRHFETGEPLPRDKIETLNRSRTFLAGLAMLRQIEFALFDFRLHDEYTPERGSRVQELLDEVRREVAVVEPPAYNRFPHSFGHVFGGGYAAGYYSYKWAEVLAADAFAAFEEAGVFDRATAERFRRAVLATGGSRNALDAFIEFRGRAAGARCAAEAVRHRSAAIAARLRAGSRRARRRRSRRAMSARRL